MDHRTLFKRSLSGHVCGYLLEPIDSTDIGEIWQEMRPSVMRDDLGRSYPTNNVVNSTTKPSFLRYSTKEFREKMAAYDKETLFWEHEFATLKERHAEIYGKRSKGLKLGA